YVSALTLRFKSVKYVSALTLRFKSVCIGFDFALRFRNLFFVDIALSLGFELISTSLNRYQFSTLNLNMPIWCVSSFGFGTLIWVSAPLALGLRSGIGSIMGSVKHSDRVLVMVTSVKTVKAQEHVTIDYLQGTTETAGPF
ncbi:hypothetical protein RhiirC2_721640, partial [Rhizophagus irregularis]